MFYSFLNDQLILLIILPLVSLLYILFPYRKPPKYLFHFTTSEHAENIYLGSNQVHLKMSNSLYSVRGIYFCRDKNLCFINRYLFKFQKMDKIIVVKTSDLNPDLLKINCGLSAVYINNYTGPGEILCYDFKKQL